MPRGRNLIFNDPELYGALNEVAEVMEINRTKHKGRPAPWKKKTLHHHVAKGASHMMQYLNDGVRADHETNKSPVAHAIARLLMALALDRRTRNGIH